MRSEIAEPWILKENWTHWYSHERVGNHELVLPLQHKATWEVPTGFDCGCLVEDILRVATEQLSWPNQDVSLLVEICDTVPDCLAFSRAKSTVDHSAAHTAVDPDGFLSIIPEEENWRASHVANTTPSRRLVCWYIKLRTARNADQEIEFEVETSGVACRLLPHFLARTYGVVTREFCKSAYDKQYIKGTLPHVQAWGYGLNFAMTQNHELDRSPRICHELEKQTGMSCLLAVMASVRGASLSMCRPYLLMALSNNSWAVDARSKFDRSSTSGTSFSSEAIGFSSPSINSSYTSLSHFLSELFGIAIVSTMRREKEAKTPSRLASKLDMSSGMLFTKLTTEHSWRESVFFCDRSGARGRMASSSARACNCANSSSLDKNRSGLSRIILSPAGNLKSRSSGLEVRSLYLGGELRM
ncbi:hypothetical protein KC320_g71 [Hortaea werneckii]|nr:hypothetical protein KC320_g71 [Hortaea werneckii]